MKRVALFLSFFSFLFSTNAVIVDPYFSPFTGAYDLRFAHLLLTQGEDFFINASNKTKWVYKVGRLCELLLWNPINQVASITQHEIFGHGYRLRELGVTPSGYSIDLYGGATNFFLEDSFPAGKYLAIAVAGLEGESILAHQVKMQWMTQKRIDARTTTLYTQTAHSSFWYSLITALGRLHDNTSTPGNDIDAYVDLLNLTYPNHHLTVKKVLYATTLNWLDPLTFFAYYSWFYYIFTGKPWAFPRIPLTQNISYLPNIRVSLAPYAIETYLENFFSIHEKPLYAYIKGSQRSAGIGIEYDSLFYGPLGSIGIHFDTWGHREFISNGTIGDLDSRRSIAIPGNNLIFGFAASLTSTLHLSSKLFLFTELGGKTNGYLPGYPLSSALTARIGLSLH